MAVKNCVNFIILCLFLVVLLSACGLIRSELGQTPQPSSPAAVTEVATTLPFLISTGTLPPKLAVESTQQPTPENEVAITKVNSYLDVVGVWTFLGLITNNSPTAVTDIQVEVELFDASGISLYKSNASIALYSLAPGESTPFTLTVSDNLPKLYKIKAVIVNKKPVELKRLAVDLSGAMTTIDDHGGVHITGKIINNSGQSAVINRLAAATFDKEGQIITAGAATVFISYLAPGESAPFRVTMNAPTSGTEKIIDYKVYIDSESASPANIFTINIFQPPYTYVDTFGWLHVLGEVQNKGVETLNIRLLAAAFDGSGNVLDAASLDLPLPALAPGESMPYDIEGWGPLNAGSKTLPQVTSFSLQWDPYWTWVIDKKYVPLVAVVNNYSYDASYGKFTGQVFNNSTGPVENTVVIVGLRNKTTGQIVGADYTTILEQIPEGGSAEYLVDIAIGSNIDPDSADYFVIAKGVRP